MKFNQFAQHVANHPQGLRVQAVRGFRDPNGLWILVIETYGPKELQWIWDRHDFYPTQEKRPLDPSFVSAQHPLLLYLKAHLCGTRVLAVLNSQWQSSSGLRFDWAQERENLDLVCGKFKSSLRLGSIKSESASKNLQTHTPETGAQLSPTTIPNSAPMPKTKPSKQTRLIQGIKADLALAEENLIRWSQEAQTLSLDPHGKGPLLNKAFAEKKKWERKVLGTQKRLTSVLAEIHPPSAAHSATQKLPRPAPSKTAKSNHLPGKVFVFSDGVRAYIGKSAQENDALFRIARDRDLWFHVRGQTGAHVWIPRNQPGFGPREAPSPALIQMGAQLALCNSPDSIKNERALVDYTERRQLKKARGSPGKVVILRSDTVWCDLDPEFLNLVRRKNTSQMQ